MSIENLKHSIENELAIDGDEVKMLDALLDASVTFEEQTRAPADTKVHITKSQATALYDELAERGVRPPLVSDSDKVSVMNGSTVCGMLVEVCDHVEDLDEPCTAIIIECSENGVFHGGAAICGEHCNYNNTCGLNKGECEFQVIKGGGQ